MSATLLAGLTGFILASFLFLIIRLRQSGKTAKESPVTVHSTIEKFRSVGELVVFKIVTKEIITTTENWFGDIGKKYFQWLASNKKIAMIFQFEIDFKYNLHSPDFDIEILEEGVFRLTMPKCLYESHIKDITIYDEQKSQVLPWLLPDLVNRVFDGGFNEETKNKLIGEAKHQASLLADEFVQKVQTEVHHSASQTLELLAKGFGARQVMIEFRDFEVIQTKMDYLTEGSPEPVD